MKKPLVRLGLCLLTGLVVVGCGAGSPDDAAGGASMDESTGANHVRSRESPEPALNHERAWTPLEEARSAEGKQLLRWLGDDVHAIYASTTLGNLVRSLEDDAGLGSNKRTGTYYEVRDRVYWFPSVDGNIGALLAAEPERDPDPWLLMILNCDQASREFEHFESKEELDARISELVPE